MPVFRSLPQLPACRLVSSAGGLRPACRDVLPDSERATSERPCIAAGASGVDRPSFPEHRSFLFGSIAAAEILHHTLCATDRELTAHVAEIQPFPFAVCRDELKLFASVFARCD